MTPGASTMTTLLKPTLLGLALLLVAAQQRNLAQLASVIARTAETGRGSCATPAP